MGRHDSYEFVSRKQTGQACKEVLNDAWHHADAHQRSIIGGIDRFAFVFSPALISNTYVARCCRDN
jgi:hypothetical protein